MFSLMLYSMFGCAIRSFVGWTERMIIVPYSLMHKPTGACPPLGDGNALFLFQDILCGSSDWPWISYTAILFLATVPFLFNIFYYRFQVVFKSLYLVLFREYTDQWVKTLFFKLCIKVGKYLQLLTTAEVGCASFLFRALQPVGIFISLSHDPVCLQFPITSDKNRQ